MTVLDRVAAILRRAEAINLSVAELCADAGVRHANVIRWRRGEGFRSFSVARDLPRLESTMYERELQVLQYLQALDPGRPGSPEASVAPPGEMGVLL